MLANTTVTSIRPHGDGYLVQTDRGVWRAGAVVLASGAGGVANVPARWPRRCRRDHHAQHGRLPQPRGLLADGGVLVVGASASGIQIAQELQRSGRPVTLAVGEHVRMPRTYRGRDILWWMDATGLLDERYDEIPDLRPGAQPAVDATGRHAERATVDLNALRTLGVRLVGRLAGIRDGIAQFSGSLPNMCALADLKLGRLLDTHRRVGRRGRD